MECFFKAPGGISIAADVFSGDTATAVFLHGGGQTRQSWKTGAEALAAGGYEVISVDLRGHGQSSWAPDGDYGLSAYIADLQAVLAQLRPQPILIGASLGGLICATAIGESLDPIARALVLVDVTPWVNPQGSQRIVSFMSANKDGFGSLEEVAAAVAAYNPHRPRPLDISGLRRNVREKEGRLYWHWDPQLLGDSSRSGAVEEFFGRAQAAVTRIRVPTLLIRGVLSDLVGPDEVQWFKRAVPHAQYVDIEGAGHMVAGDRNDAFNGAILDFINRLMHQDS